METTDTCTCKRYFGMSREERIHHAIDDFLGVKTKFIPKTKEENEKQKLEYELVQEKLLQEKKDYLLSNNIEITNLSVDEISSEYDKCKYDNMPDDKIKIFATNYNFLRILRGGMELHTQIKIYFITFLFFYIFMI